jgi:hypothetical protein
MNNYVDSSLGDIYVSDYTTNVYKSPTISNLEVQYGANLETKLSEKTKEKKMAISKGKRGLFQVILVDPKTRKILLNTIVIADSIEDVLLEVDAGKVIKEANLLVSDVDKIVTILGEVRKTRKSKSGDIEIVNEDNKE